ncbi:MAG: S26 family signal peptidase [Verrucomicrobiaceae bacterium]|nr:MAG: S26 family signal peptidase [Verrucomicrobiaceae bacterium]
MTVALANPKIRLGPIGKKIAILLAGAAAIFLLVVPINAARFVWNTSQSAPTGIYWIDQGRWDVGERVAVRPSRELAIDLDARGILPSGKLLIKRIAAGEGDRVCRLSDAISINGFWVVSAKTSTSTGAKLPAWEGCQVLSAGDVFLLGDTANSYDGRYFGVTHQNEILGQVTLVLSLQKP